MAKTPLQTMKRRGRVFVGSQRRQARRSMMATTTIAVAAVVIVAVAAWGLWRVGTAVAERRVKQSALAAAEGTATKSSTGLFGFKRKAKAPAAKATASRPETITIAAVGDMQFDRNVADLVSVEGGEAPFTDVAPDLKAADVTIGNLESVLSRRGEPKEDKDVTFRGSPSAITGLSSAGFDFLSLANNHVMDYGPDALSDTLSGLNVAGIAHAGAGVDQSAAWRPATYEKDGTKVAYLAFSHVVPEGFIALADRPGMASGVTKPERVRKTIAEAKRTHDYVIVSFHWGVEYEDNANDEQQKWAHDAVDAGADMVLAHHPHVIQGVEFYKNKLIAYSLGDFVFDHYSRKTGEAFILNAELGPDGVASARAVPVYLNESGKPEYVTGSEATTILTRLRDISKPYGTSVKIADDEARLRP